MTAGLQEMLRRWLAAERQAAQGPRARSGRSSAAEDALFAIMKRLPDLAPRPGFAERVLAAADLRPVAAPASPPLAWALRALLALCLFLTAIAVASLPALLEMAAARITLAEIVSGLARTFTFVVDLMAVAVAVGNLLAALYDALLLVLTAPPVAVGWLGALAFTALTLRWLARLLAPWEERRLAERSSGYVSAHG